MAAFEKYWDDFPFDQSLSGEATLGYSQNGEGDVNLHKGYRPGSLTFNHTGNARRFLYWPDGASITDGEIACKFGWFDAPPGGNVTGHGVGMRCSGATAGDFSGVLACRYGDSLIIRYYLSGSVTDLVSAPMGSSFWESDYIIKLQCSGDSVKAKIWHSGDPEPSTWTLETTQTAIPSAGNSGIWFFYGSEQHIQQLKWSSAGDSIPPMEYEISGTVEEAGNPSNTPLERVVKAFRRSNNEIPLGGETISAADGSYKVIVPSGDAYTIFCLDELVGDYNALIFDKVLPGPVT